MRKRVLVLAVAFLLLLSGLAMAYPTRNITFVIPFNPGGATDVVGRQLAQFAEKYLGTRFIIDNRPGAGSGIGMNFVYNSRPDGYTLGLGGAHLVVSSVLQATQYPAHEFTNIARINLDPFVLAVRADSPYQSIEGLIAATHEQAISLGNAGVNTTTYMVCAAINSVTGANFNIVPADGGAQMRALIIGGHIDGGIFSQSELIGYEEELRPLLVMSDQRTVLYPEVPCVAEFGWTGIPEGSWRMVTAPPGLSEDIKSALVEAFHKVVNDPEWIAWSQSNGFIELFLAGEELDQYVRDQEELFTDLVQAIGLE
ncbi:MAG: tripartite tricarboxylate transporter substrate binding protein [Limnochordia bacterium]|jgi:putative tricarboxylic transport membrane protein|nr:tripartite tricarboxylate transporter substrate binding protein [Limnochordia bacterium]MDI9464970.1 tripartite tricarboxylate transporter substrate binding protein [Bacillota bacterium]HOB41143.1 tripartite tricarboxylate transporter substrate binding protein [Limnochordia bacterium]HOK32088.1 tripartite tricarboxylate transporter substrate binding protein [Limnochordia bacterium]HOM00679.1 tripartite tricarboxylate transporter substrate binding protein [Limnochordia bacterium]